MNDIVPEHQTPTNVLAKQGVAAIGNLIGGVGLLVMNVLPRPVGLGLGAVLLIVGIASLRSKDQADRRPGLIVTIAGALSVLARAGANLPLIPALSGTLLSVGAVGLLAMGIWNGIKFLKGLKSRG
ncbi:hypothetical protein FACS1894142_5150 [Spirochaetia bacterium]|nr:hypothetical protein FACS1894142_5150 [Spirochaetia bacterium]